MSSERRQRPHQPHELGPRLEKRGRFWSCDLRPWSGPRRVTLRDPRAPGWPGRGKGARTEDREIAERWRWAYVDLKRGTAKRSALGLGRTPTAVEALVTEYLQHRERMQAAPGSVASASAALRVHLVPGLGRATVSDAVTRDRLQRIVDRLADEGYAPSSLRTLRKLWHAFFAWVAREEGHSVNPASGLVTPIVDPSDVRTFDEDERAALRAAADRIDRDGVSREVRALLASRPDRLPPRVLVYRRALELGLNTGGRVRELFALTEAAFRAADCTVRFTAQVGARGGLRRLKGHNARTALVLPAWWAWHRPATAGAATRRVLEIGDRSLSGDEARWIRMLYLTAERYEGLAPVPTGIGWHALRHTYARQFLELGGRLEELQHSLGHQSITTTETYYGHVKEDRAAASAHARIYGTTTTKRGTHGA